MNMNFSLMFGGGRGHKVIKAPQWTNDPVGLGESDANRQTAPSAQKHKTEAEDSALYEAIIRIKRSAMH